MIRAAEAAALLCGLLGNDPSAEETSVALAKAGKKKGNSPGKHAKNSGKSQFLMGKPTISMAIFNSNAK